MQSSFRRNSISIRHLNSSNNSQSQVPTNTRYWENYLVRYFLPTVVGAILVWILLWQIPESYGLPNVLTKRASIDSTFFALIGLAGFVYCYLSSSLVLVMHYGRWKGWSDDKANLQLFNGRRTPWKLRVKTAANTTVGSLLLAALLSSVFLLGSIQLVVTNNLSVLINLDDVYLMEAALFAVAWQWVIACQVFAQRTEMYTFYKALTNARSQTGYNGFVESYRHLREHGNAFFIVLAEILFFFYLYVGIKLILPETPWKSPALQMTFGALFTVAWILPGVYAWHLGTALELQLAKENPKGDRHAP